MDLENVFDTTEVHVLLLRSNNDYLNLSPSELTELEESMYFKDTVYKAGFEYGTNSWEFYPDFPEVVDIWAYTQMDLYMYLNQGIIGDQSKDLAYGECIAGNSSAIRKEDGNIKVMMHPERNQFTNNHLSEPELKPGILVDLTIKKQISNNNIYLNYNHFVDICNSLNIPIVLYSAEFVIKDARNISKVHEFLSTCRLFQSEHNYNGYTYQILDGILNDRMEPIKLKIKIMEGLIPFMYGLVGGLGFLISCLLVKSDKHNFYLMKGIGTPQYFPAFLFVLKRTICCLFSAFFGLILIPGFHILLYIVCYMGGSLLVGFKLFTKKGIELAWD
jgi:hypothetical protein